MAWYIFIKNLMKRIPFAETVVREIKRKYFFESSEIYWIERYQKGGNSGPGSYSKFADFKATIINNFIIEKNIETVIEFGCGDGNQLRLANYPNYLGLDLSQEAIDRCKNIFTNDRSKSFELMKDYAQETAQLALSLDVIYHLVEDEVFEQYMKVLFGSSTEYIIIYSSNQEGIPHTPPHVRYRKFSDWIDQNQAEWQLYRYIQNRYPFESDADEGSISDFYIYNKIPG